MNKASAESLRDEGKKAFFRLDFKTAFARFEEAAVLGDAEAQCRLGELYDDFGRGIPVDFRKARELYEKSYAQGFARAGTQLYAFYDGGDGVPRDKKKAQAFLDEALSRGDPLAKLFKGIELLARDEEEEAIALFKEAEADPDILAEFGALSAFYAAIFDGDADVSERIEKARAIAEEQAERAVLSGWYWLVLGHLLCDEEAEKYYRRAADSGSSTTLAGLAQFLLKRGNAEAAKFAQASVDISRSPAALVALGGCFSEGIGVEEDDAKAETLLKEAIEKSDPEDDADDLANANYFLGGIKLSAGDEAAAEKYYLKADELGHTFAAVVLAGIYFNREPSDPKAFTWAKKGADAGDGDAMMVLACCYRNGIGTEVDKGKELEWSCKAADAGNAVSALLAGLAFLVDGDEVSAKKYFLRADELGEARAAGALARMYFAREPSDPKAFTWAQKGAEAGDGDAMEFLACCYRDGVGTDADDEKKREWNLKAADVGNAVGAYNAGVNFRNADDEVSAEKYFLKADELGVAEAAGALARMYFDREPSDPKAFTWARKGAEVGDGYAMMLLACCYRDGVGTEVDEEKEREWNLKAADAGDAKGAYNAGVGFLNAGDEASAEKYLLKAEELGDAVAAFNLGMIYEDRDDWANAEKHFRVSIDLDGGLDAKGSLARLLIQLERRDDAEEILRLAKESVDEDSSHGYWPLGKCHELGVGVPKNPKKAAELFARGAELGSNLCREALDALGGK